MMADTILTRVQLEDIFRNVTCATLGLDPTDPINGSKVRQSWPTGGAPAWTIADDVVFIRVKPIRDRYSAQRDTEYLPDSATQLNVVTSYTLPIMVSWTLYGPNSFDDAETIRNGLFSARETLNASNLYLIVDIPVPVRSPELFVGQWWDRSDFSATFYEKVTRRSIIPTIDTVTAEITGTQITIKEG